MPCLHIYCTDARADLRLRYPHIRGFVKLLSLFSTKLIVVTTDTQNVLLFCSLNYKQKSFFLSENGN